MNSRPLPYQGSALPLSYASLYDPTLQSYRERSRPSVTRTAKNASRTKQRSRYLPGSIVRHALTAISPSSSSAIAIRPLPAGLKSIQHQPVLRKPLQAPANCKVCGAQGRVRTSVGHNPADLQSAAINHSATCALCLPKRFETQHSLHPSTPGLKNTTNRVAFPAGKVP